MVVPYILKHVLRQEETVLLDTATQHLILINGKLMSLLLDNQAYSLELGNSIYMDSIQSCVWAKYKNMTFCWKGWFFANGGSCLDQLRSGPAYITNNGPAKYTVYPGECINLRDFTVFDDWGNDITETDYSSS